MSRKGPETDRRCHTLTAAAFCAAITTNKASEGKTVISIALGERSHPINGQRGELVYLPAAESRM
jgi:hypothetical protein